MILRKRSQRDPFWDDGQGVRQSRAHDRLVGALAFATAVTACGLTAAAWLRELAPMFSSLPFG